MNHLHTCCLLLASFSLFPSAHANLTLKLEVVTHVQPKSTSKNVPEDSHAALDVVLAGKAFLVRSAKETTIFDFDKRKRVVVDNNAKTQVNYSLYDTVGFRLFELRNRNMLGKALAVANVDPVAMSAVENEHILAIQERPSSPLQTSANGIDEVFLNDSTEFFRRSIKSTPVSTDEARMFSQVLRYFFGGHPQILGALANSHSIASQLLLTTYDAMGATTRSVTLKSVGRSDNTAFDIPAYPVRQAAASIDPVDRVLDRAESITPAELLASRQRSRDELSSAFHDGRILDAYLGCIEWSLMTGEGMPALTAEQKAKFQSDATAIKVGAALAARTKGDLQNAIKVFEDVRNSTSVKAYVAKIFEANNRSLLGDSVTARKLFVEVLSINPYIAGVYKDIGDVQFRDFDMARAWRSWDLGRRIAPQFDIFNGVNQFERALVGDHPEFF